MKIMRLLIIVIYSLFFIYAGFSSDTRYNEDLNMPQSSGDGGPVSLQTGALSLCATDLTLPGACGLNFSVSRSYSSVIANVYNMATNSNAASLATVHTAADWKYGLGSGWTFSWPFLFRDIDDTAPIKKLNLFMGGAVFEIDESQNLVNDPNVNNLKYYAVNDLRFYRDTSVVYPGNKNDPTTGAVLQNGGVHSQYCLELKSGMKYYFSEAGNLMLIENPSDPGDLRKPRIWFYYLVHRLTSNGDEYKANRSQAKIELAVDSTGTEIDFVYSQGQENWLEEIRYQVVVRGQVEERSVKYSHLNLSTSPVKRIDSANKQLAVLSPVIPAGDKKFSLCGYTNQLGHYTRYNYGLYEAPFSFRPASGSGLNYFVNLESVQNNYTESGGKAVYRNMQQFGYNQPEGVWSSYERDLASGFMSGFKVTSAGSYNKYGVELNHQEYGYYGKSYGKLVNEYWSTMKRGGINLKSVYGASGKETEDNLLLYKESEANGGTFLERVDYVYDVRKTLKAKSTYRNGLLKYTESYIYDNYNDLIWQKAKNGLETETVYHNKYHVPVHVLQHGIKNGDGSFFDIESENVLRESDGKPLSESIYMNVGGERKAVKLASYTYDQYGNVATITDVLGHTVSTFYDAALHIFPEEVRMQVTLDGVLKTVHGIKLFNTDGTVWIESDNDGYAIEHLYDVLGTELKKILPDENDNVAITTIADLSSSTWKDSRADNKYIEMQIDYQAESTLTYGEEFNGKRVKSGAFADGLGHVEREVLYESATSDVVYSVKEMVYDKYGNMIALTDPDASATAIKMPVMGKMVAVHDKTWLVWYDDLGRKLRVQYPDENKVVVKKELSYDDEAYSVTTTNTKGYQTIENYDYDGNLIRFTRPEVKDETGVMKDLVYSFEYNQLKQRIAFTNPSGERISYCFDERGLMTKQDYGDGGDLLTYNLNGKLECKRDRNQNLIKFYYDELSRNIRQEYYKSEDLNNPYDYIQLGYNGRGNLTKVTSEELSEEMTYDSRGRIVKIVRSYGEAELRQALDSSLDWVTSSEEGQEKFSFLFSYTPNNLMDKVQLPNGKEISYNYDLDKLRLTGIKADVNGALAGIITGVTYNRAGQVTELNYGNGTKQQWWFDARSRIKKISVANNITNLFNLNYSVDTENNITRINDNYFEYDELDRLMKSEIVHLGELDYREKVLKAFGTSQATPQVGEAVFDEVADLNKDGVIDGWDHAKACQEWKEKYDRESFNYDFNGNRRELEQNGQKYSYIYGGHNHLLSVEKEGKPFITYQYDNNGNTIKRTEYHETGSPTVYDFFYDINNRLTEVKKDGVRYSRYIYDNSGMRMYKEEGGKATFYFRNSGTVMYEVEIDRTKREVTENNYVVSGELIAGRITRKNNTNEEVYYYHLDHLNSTKAVTDKTGAVVQMYEYRAFGSELDKQGTDTNHFSFIGREFDEEIGLYYLNARYYDATIGRFINVDPIQDGTNWYVYCDNNPLSMIDPTGLEGKNIVAWDKLVSTIKAGIIDYTKHPVLKDGNLYTHYQAKITQKLYNYLGAIDADPATKKPFWWACAGGACNARNQWISPTINPISNAEGLKNSGEIEYYKDAKGNAISDPQKLAPLLKPGDIITFQPTADAGHNTWHTITVLENDPKKGEITYLEYHEYDKKNPNKPLVEIWKSPYSDLNHFTDEQLYGGGKWKEPKKTNGN